MNESSKYEVHFPAWYDQRGEWEAKEKGWLDGVEFRFADGKTPRAHDQTVVDACQVLVCLHEFIETRGSDREEPARSNFGCGNAKAAPAH